MSELEKRVQRLEDVEAIRRLKWKYALAADERKDRADLFAENGAWDNNRYGRVVGREAIRKFLATAPAKIEWSLHFLQDTNIEIAPDRRTARGRWYLLETARMNNPKTNKVETVWINGVYDDELVRRGEAWLFSVVKLDIQKIIGESGVWD